MGGNRGDEIAEIAPDLQAKRLRLLGRRKPRRSATLPITPSTGLFWIERT
jgi:hypothetical protein